MGRGVRDAHSPEHSTFIYNWIIVVSPSPQLLEHTAKPLATLGRKI